MNHVILVVDDERDFLESVKRALVVSGYKNIRLLDDPLEAAELVEEGEHYDVALLDISMSGMTGVELLERIKMFSPTTECIMLSALHEISLVVECFQKGALDYLVKPFSREALVLRVERALEQKHVRDS